MERANSLLLDHALRLSLKELVELEDHGQPGELQINVEICLAFGVAVEVAIFHEVDREV